MRRQVSGKLTALGTDGSGSLMRFGPMCLMGKRTSPPTGGRTPGSPIAGTKPVLLPKPARPPGCPASVQAVSGSCPMLPACGIVSVAPTLSLPPFFCHRGGRATFLIRNIGNLGKMTWSQCFPFIPNSKLPRGIWDSLLPHQSFLGRLPSSALPRGYKGPILGFSLQACWLSPKAMPPYPDFIRN